MTRPLRQWAWRVGYPTALRDDSSWLGVEAPAREEERWLLRRTFRAILGVRHNVLGLSIRR